MRLFSLLFIFVSLVGACACESAPAQCRQLFRQHVVQSYVAPVYAQQVVAYTPQYVNQNVRYFLGEDLQIEALAQKISPQLAPRLAKELAPLVARELQLLNNNNGNGNATPPNGSGDSGGLSGGGLSIRQMPLFSAKCARCHTGENPSSGISFENGMTDKSFRKFVLMFQSNTFPKPMQFIVNMTPQDKGAITEEIGKFVDDSAQGSNRENVLPPKPNPPDSEGGLK